MVIADKVYGRVEVKETVLIELIKSRPLQRLKKINQAGTQLVITEYKEISRYNHCIGVMLLLRRFDATLEEQIAGLIHDVPHTAFSHAIDFVMNDENQTFHEKFLEKMVYNSEIPKILKKYKMDIKFILDEHNFPLMERQIPRLCADRIDYFLKDIAMKGQGFGNPNSYLNHLKIYKNEFVFDDFEIARKFAYDFMKKCLESWNSPKTIATFGLLSSTIKKALTNGDLKQSYLFETDNFVLQKLRESKDTKIRRNLKLLNPNLKYSTTDQDYDFQMRGKVRYVDPKILINGKQKKLSQIDASFKEIIPLFKETIKKGHKIKILS